MDGPTFSGDALNRPLRIAIVTETYPPEVNGVALTLIHIVRGLQQRGNFVQLIRPRQSASDRALTGPRYEEILVKGMPVPGYPGVRTGWPVRGTLRKLWRSTRPDIVHVATEGVLGWLALRTARKLKIPVATDFHTNFHSYSKHYGFGLLLNAIFAYLRWLHNRADCTMVPTEAMCRELAADGFENLRIVARGVDTTLFHPLKRSRDLRRSWGVTDDDTVVLCVGRIAPEKNWPLLFRAFEAMRAVTARSKLVVVGDGPSRGELQTAHPQHLFAGMRRDEDLAAHYASGDIFVFPSTTETYGNVTVEAMASGLAVVAFDYAAAHDHIVHWNNGVLAPVGHIERFIAKAVDLIKCPQQAALIRHRARTTAEKLSWDAVVACFELELRRLVSGGRTQNELTLVPSGAN